MKMWIRAIGVAAVLAAVPLVAQQGATHPAGTAAPAARTAAAASADVLRTATPESVGMSTERLMRLHKGMQAFVDRHEAGGIVTLLTRDGKVVDVHAVGFQDVASKTPMKADTIFRIASMSKPITTVAILMLYEEGKLLLTDPVSRYIPAFRTMRVANADGTTTPATRQITIRDLLTHRSGLSYGFLNGGPVGEAYRKAGVTDGLSSTPMTLAQGIDLLAAQPLMAQPGSAWNYSLGFDVLGRVVEVVSGMPFDVFLSSRIFKPLDMYDTSFVVPDTKWQRVATMYSPDGAGGIRPMKDPESFGNARMSPVASYETGKTYFSGGAGLTSTARDYARFANMLLGGGALGSVRLLSPKSVELMASNHTSDISVPALVGPGAGFGLGVRVITDPAATQTEGSAGMYGWLGIYGTVFWVDPKEHLVAIMMVQRYPGPTEGNAFQPLVYQAITKSLAAR
jgi:CubicO group peptidase (beta-lactamase class C family)